MTLGGVYQGKKNDLKRIQRKCINCPEESMCMVNLVKHTKLLPSLFINKQKR